ncbi:MAG: O-antigen ligase family protein, partial [Bacteroidales bacterium]|nr:O-antigen ligase family protein [Bacteroidales bacterium]
MNQTKKKNRKLIEKKSHSLSSYIFIIILIGLIPVFQLTTTIDLVLFPRLLILSITILCFLLFLIFRKKYKPNIVNIFNSPALWAISAFFLISIISLFWAINVPAGLFDVSKTFIMLMVLFVAIILIYENKNFITILTKTIVVMALFFSILGLYQYVERVLPDPKRIIEGGRLAIYAVRGTMTHKNQFAIAMFLMLPFLIYSIIINVRIWKNLSIISAILIFINLILLQTRSVWVGLIFSLMATLIIGVIFRKKFDISFSLNKKNRVLLYLIGVSIVVFIGAVGVYLTKTKPGKQIRKQAITLTEFKSKNALERIEIWTGSVKMMKEGPVLGVGAGNWKLLFPKYTKRRSNAKTVISARPHNDYIWVAVEKGIFGIISFLLIFFFIIKDIFKILIHSGDKTEKLKVLLMFSGISGYMAIAFFSFPQERINHQVYLMVIFAIVISSYYKTFPDKIRKYAKPQQAFI